MDIGIRSARNNILVFQISPKGLKATWLNKLHAVGPFVQKSSFLHIVLYQPLITSGPNENRTLTLHHWARVLLTTLRSARIVKFWLQKLSLVPFRRYDPSYSKICLKKLPCLGADQPAQHPTWMDSPNALLQKKKFVHHIHNCQISEWLIITYRNFLAAINQKNAELNHVSPNLSHLVWCPSIAIGYFLLDAICKW
jgi:hypothetical protein